MRSSFVPRKKEDLSALRNKYLQRYFDLLLLGLITSAGCSSAEEEVKMSLQLLFTVGGTGNLFSSISVLISLVMLILLFVLSIDRLLFRQQYYKAGIIHDDITTSYRLLKSIVKPF